MTIIGKFRLKYSKWVLLRILKLSSAKRTSQLHITGIWAKIGVCRGFEQRKDFTRARTIWSMEGVHEVLRNVEENELFFSLPSF